MRVLGIETSCDETAAGVVGGELDSTPRMLANVIHTQVATHAPFGGVVPEIASREHITRIVGVVQQAVDEVGGWQHIDAIGVTRGPGLVGCLLVGMQVAKGLAFARGLPWLGVNHLEGHLCAALLAEKPPSYPHIALLVSGGHTQLYHVHRFGSYELLGGTRDDAAGEAFDKVAKMLGLGYPGGVRVQEQAEGGNPAAFALPRSLPSNATYEFSFSGLKTACAQHIRQHPEVCAGQERRDFCASLQEAIADILTKKAVLAARRLGAGGVALAGGVAANSRLRQLLEERCQAKGLWAFLPPKVLCTDNGAMIAAAAWMRLQRGQRSPWPESARSRWSLTSADLSCKAE